MFFHLLEEIRREWCRLLHTHKFIWTKTCKQCGRLKPLFSSTSGAQEMWKSVGASDGHREREGVNRRNIERRVQEQRKKRSWNVLKFDDDTVILYETTWLQYDSILVRRIVPNLKDWEKERLEAFVFVHEADGEESVLGALRRVRKKPLDWNSFE